MKSLIPILILILTQGAVFATPQPTPVSGHMIAKTPMDKLTLRLRHQNFQIERELKTGKLTKTQAKSLKGQVEAIRKAELADLKQNGTKNLTDDQVAQINQQLNTLSKSIPIR